MQGHDKSLCHKGYLQHKKYRSDHLTNTTWDHDNGSYTPTTLAPSTVTNGLWQWESVVGGDEMVAPS